MMMIMRQYKDGDKMEDMLQSWYREQYFIGLL